MKVQIRHYAPIWQLLPASLAEPMRRDAKCLALQRIHAEQYLKRQAVDCTRSAARTELLRLRKLCA